VKIRRFFSRGSEGRDIWKCCWYSLIIAGQMVSVFMDRKDLLEEILNETKKS
jgi:hypothetical protein